MRKKYYYCIFILLTFFSFILFSESKEQAFIFSSWVPETYVKHIDPNLPIPCISDKYNKDIPNISLLITLKNVSNDFGSFGISGYNPVVISSYNFLENNHLELLCNYLISKTGSFELSNDSFSICIKIINEDVIVIDNMSVNYDLYGIKKGSTWYRISGSAHIPVKSAVLNDSRVRLRVKPNFNCDTWGYLNKGDKVTVKDKSDESFTIDSESWYWYKVDAGSYPDGWVYGKYLDIE